MNHVVLYCSIKLTYYVTIHYLRTIKRNADHDFKVNYDVISYVVKTIDVLHIAVKLIGGRKHSCVPYDVCFGK